MGDGYQGSAAVQRFGDADTPLGLPGVEAAMFDGELVVFHEPTGMVHHLTSGASAVWLLCDGETPVGSMAAELGGIFGIEPTHLADDVHLALQHLSWGGLLVDDAEPAARDNGDVDDVADDVEAPDQLAAHGVRTLRRPPSP